MTSLENLQQLSNSLADAADVAGKAVVRVDDGTRFTASGLLWNDDLVVATSHGVEADENLGVILHDGSTLDAKLVGRDHGSDVCVLRISGGQKPLSKTEKARAGEIVLAVARPGDRGLQVTMGVVSSAQPRANGHLYYTDATLGPGFSGGALVSASGELVGMINLWSRRRMGVAIGVGLVQESVDAILKGGEVRRGYLGVRAQVVELPRERYSQAVGLLIAAVDPDSAAERAGLLIGDVLLEVGGHSLVDVDSLSQILRGSRAGNSVQLRVVRAGQILDLDAELQAHP